MANFNKSEAKCNHNWMSANYEDAARGHEDRSAGFSPWSLVFSDFHQMVYKLKTFHDPKETCDRYIQQCKGRRLSINQYPRMISNCDLLLCYLCYFIVLFVKQEIAHMCVFQCHKIRYTTSVA